MGTQNLLKIICKICLFVFFNVYSNRMFVFTATIFSLNTNTHFKRALPQGG